jgi:hypothetical protein
MHRLALAVLAGLIAAATGPARADDLMQRAQQTFKPIPASIPAVRGSIVTKDRIAWTGQRPGISLPVLPVRTESTPLSFQTQGTPPPAGLPTITVIGHRSTATGGPVDSTRVAARG